MLDFAKNEEEEKSFIVDIETTPDTMIIKYADGHEVTEKLSKHNLNVYRYRMERQALANIDFAYDTLAKDSFVVCMRKLLAIVGGIICGIIFYNIDVHIIMRIVLYLLLLLGEAYYYIYSELFLSVLGDDLREVEATDCYLKNINLFKYFDDLEGETGYIIPIEDIDRHRFTKEQLEKLAIIIKEFKNEGVEEKNISLTYGNDDE